MTARNITNSNIEQLHHGWAAVVYAYVGQYCLALLSAGVFVGGDFGACLESFM